VTGAWTLVAWERGRHESPLERAVTLLSAVTGLSREESAGVDVGSRDSVLWGTLGRMTAGVVVGCVLCRGCGERLDVPLDLGTLPVGVWRTPGETLYAETAGGVVAYRLPDSRDLRMVLGGDVASGRALLLSRCVQGGDVSEDVAAAVEAAMEEAAPSCAVTLRVGCPDCTTETVAALDVATLLWAEVEWRAVALLHDVHVLARAYGWTESDVLALSPTRRAAYLELVGG
jgi:hypothetical protein